MVGKVLILLLLFVSARVAIGLWKQKIMWKWIVLYWLILTIKNLAEVIVNARMGV